MASIGMGTFLASSEGAFDGTIFTLAISTTIFLQILSNLSNDYGDFVHGADHKERTGPERAVQSGRITPADMKRAIGFFVLLSLISGVGLIYFALGFQWDVLIFFLVLGLLAIGAAITYTSGYRPYGYMGLGDISVVIFFGLTGVMGSYYLFTQQLDAWTLLPALSVGFFSTAVLNVNNIRDIESDGKAGKRSIPVRLGREASVFYHWSLLIIGLTCAMVYVLLTYSNLFEFLFLIVIPLLWINAAAVKKYKQASQLDPYLKQMAITTLVFVLTFGIGQLIA
jgi:1,4-dihydroxy-2-naphthoate octaprenyltransferase